MTITLRSLRLRSGTEFSGTSVAGNKKKRLEKAALLPEECLMVGNDVDDDMPAQNTGMKVFLLTDCLINRNKKDISAFEHGNFEKLTEYFSIVSFLVSFSFLVINILKFNK